MSRPTPNYRAGLQNGKRPRQLKSIERSATDDTACKDIRIYLAPTSKSIDSFRAICTHEETLASITELVYLPEVYGSCETAKPRFYKAKYEDDLINGSPDLLSKYLVVDDEALEESYSTYKSLLEDHQEDYFGPRCLLAQILPKMTALKKIGVQRAIDREGLNADRYFYAESFTDIYGVVSYSTSADSKDRLAYRQPNALNGKRRIVNVGALFGALRNAEDNVRITHLSVGNGLDDQLRYTIFARRYCTPGAETLKAVGANLTHLSVSIKDSNGENYYEEDDKWSVFFASCTKLTHLRVYLEKSRSEHSWHSARERGTMLSNILPHQSYPHLQTFEVIGETAKPASIRAVWLKAVVERHKASLRKLELSGVLPVNWYRPEQAVGTLGALLRYLQLQTKLETVTMLIKRRNEHQNRGCWGSSKDGSECDKTCTSYLLINHWLAVEKLEKMADEVGVWLRDDQWDFSDFVMRA